jgi:hypothetical protein
MCKPQSGTNCRSTLWPYSSSLYSIYLGKFSNASKIPLSRVGEVSPQIRADIHSFYLRISYFKITFAKMSSSAENQSQTADKLDDTASGLQSLKTAETPESSSRGNAQETSIDPENEITGTRLLLLHIGLCLTTFITGLVS